MVWRQSQVRSSAQDWPVDPIQHEVSMSAHTRLGLPPQSRPRSGPPPPPHRKGGPEKEESIDFAVKELFKVERIAT